MEQKWKVVGGLAAAVSAVAAAAGVLISAGLIGPSSKESPSPSVTRTFVKPSQSERPRSPVTIPAIRGAPSSLAERKLRGADLIVMKVDQLDRDIPAGSAIGTVPSEGSIVEAGTSVTLLVWRGQPRPDVVLMLDGILSGDTRCVVGGRHLDPEVPRYQRRRGAVPGHRFGHL
jgi:hypothetical protein